MQGRLEFRNVSKRFNDVLAVDNISFSVRGGDFFSLLGPSGCGKTTLLRLVAGFEQPDQGKIFLDGQDITKLPPNQRPINTVFQNYALFPHLTIWDNIAFGLVIKQCPKDEIKEKVSQMLKLIQMEDHAWKRPHQISGGQKQRVAIARALINKPRVLLLDEPLAALDLKLRQKMLFEIDLIHDEVGITFLFVTHDQTEAMAVSDQIAVMHHGCVEQIGKPVELYEAPKSSFVAAFIGDTNFLDGHVTETLKDNWIELTIEGFPHIRCYNDKQCRSGEAVHLSIRPEKINIGRDKPALDDQYNCFEGVVEDIVYKGDRTNYWVRIDEYLISVAQQHNRFFLGEKPIRWEEKVWVWWHGDDGYILETWQAADENLMQIPPEGIGMDDDAVLPSEEES